MHSVEPDLTYNRWIFNTKHERIPTGEEYESVTISLYFWTVIRQHIAFIFCADGLFEQMV